MKLLNILRRFRKDESGASMVEYGVALLVVTAIGITAMSAMGTRVGQLVVTACNAVGATGCTT